MAVNSRCYDGTLFLEDIEEKLKNRLVQLKKELDEGQKEILLRALPGRYRPVKFLPQVFSVCFPVSPDLPLPARPAADGKGSGARLPDSYLRFSRSAAT